MKQDLIPPCYPEMTHSRKHWYEVILCVWNIENSTINVLRFEAELQVVIMIYT